MEPSPQVYWSPITEEGKSHWTRPEVEEAVIRKPVVAFPRFSFTPPEDETASIELHFPSTVSSTLPEAESVLILSVSLTAILRLPEALFASREVRESLTEVLMEPEAVSAF